MFFNAYLGNKENLSDWINVINEYANWLNFDPLIEVRSLNNEKVFSFAWLKHKSSNESIRFVENSEYIVLNTENSPIISNSFNTPWEYFKGDIDKPIIQLGISLATGEIRVLQPLATPEQFYFSNDSRGWMFGNDLRLMLQWRELDIDDHAVYALFKYHSIPAPLTISKNIKRVPNGYQLKILPNSSEPILEVSQEIKEYVFSSRSYSDLDLKGKRLENIFDEILGGLPKSSSLFFSGGVDSTLLALRLSELNRTDVNMINYVSGSSDTNDNLASQAAKYLNLPLNKVYYDPDIVPSILNNIIRDYSYPFADASTLFGNDLARLSLKLFGNTPAIVDGSGADCIFVGDMPVYLKFNKIYKIPSGIRNTISEMYKALDMWKTSSLLTKPFRAVRRAALMPIQSIELGCIFDGITYNIPDEILNDLREMYTTYVSAIFEGYEENTQRLTDYKFTSILNLIKASSAGSAAKTYDFLRLNGVKLVCPFFDPKVLRLNYSIPWDQKTSEEPKALLKRMMSPQIPHELINHPKQAFMPLQEILDNQAMKDLIDSTVLNENGPLSEFIDITTVRRILNHRDKHMDPDFFTHLWIIIFTSIWIKQLKTSFSHRVQPVN